MVVVVDVAGIGVGVGVRLVAGTGIGIRLGFEVAVVVVAVKSLLIHRSIANNLPAVLGPTTPTVIHISVRSFSIRAEEGE